MKNKFQPKYYTTDNYTTSSARNLKFNLVVNILDGCFFGLALGFASWVTVIPLFVSAMTSSAILIGLIPAIHSIGWQLPQLFTSKRVSMQRRLKTMVLAITSLERMPFLAFAGVAWFSPSMNTQTTLFLTFSLLIFGNFSGGFSANAWQSLMAKIMPANWRGTFFGSQAAAANLFASAGAILAGLILGRMGSPMDFTICFLLAFGAMVISFFFLALTREQEGIRKETTAWDQSYWDHLKDILSRDKNFRWYLVGRAISQLAVMGAAFYSVFAVSQLGISEVTVGLMTGTMMGVKIVANPLMGWLGDRWSHRSVIAFGLSAATLAALIAWLASSTFWFFIVFTLAGISDVAIWTLGLSMTLEFGTEDERPAYIGMANTFVAPANILAPLLGGWLANVSGYPAAFLVSAAGGLVSVLVYQFKIQDPKLAPPLQTSPVSAD